MSGTRPTPAEHHLGDRLAALVDGELGHDARERVLAHLATCARCKAEADAQRRLKNLFAESAPPPPPAGLLARLQGLPGGAAGGDGGPPFGGGGLGAGGWAATRQPGGAAGAGMPGTGPARGGAVRDAGVLGVGPGGFGYVPAEEHAPAAGSGFRIHEVGREAAERSPWRGRRFAFAAASAVSFAAIALGGAMPTVTAVDVRGEGSGNSVKPLRSSPAGQQAAAESTRRRPPAGTGAGMAASPGTGRFADRSGVLVPGGVQVRARHPAAPPFLPAAPPLVGADTLPLIGATPVPARAPYPSHKTPPTP
ncbi:zf-HC2 domain-containing protein [Streptomyces fradiae]|uniref:zf-HC2 domain-containing protein n=1 Tax=Streptomyces fradiae TaxID=1906 RepID=UPI0029436DEA|nr:zf-HC2 domain-containing protein [Streptomyces fradiae]WOI62620.1 zf-HC2 domain-containing protein [Streptomyces fradiae]